MAGKIMKVAGLIKKKITFQFAGDFELWLPAVKEPEQNFKTQLSAMLAAPAYQPVLLPEQVMLFTKYIAQDKVYFHDKAYNEEAVDLLYGTLRAFPALLDLGCKSTKLQLLNMCLGMMEGTDVKFAGSPR